MSLRKSHSMEKTRVSTSSRTRALKLNFEEEPEIENFRMFGKNSPTISALKSISNLQRSHNSKMFSFADTPKQTPIQSSYNDSLKKPRTPSRPTFSAQPSIKPSYSNPRSGCTPRSSLNPSISTASLLRRPSTPRESVALKTQNSESVLAKPSTPRNSSLSSVVTRVKKDSLKGEAAHKEHLTQTFNALRFVRSLKPLDPYETERKKVDLPKRRGYENKKTVVFDLDETLVHCCDDPSKAHTTITVTFPTGESINAGVNIRPYARECLISANRDFEVIIFTASHKCYADRVLDYLDPTGQLIHHRLYRENCVVSEGVFMKDLRILANRRLEDLILVDNAAYSFGYQLDNGIPIISWYEDMNDRELYKLMDYLKVLARVSDVREINRRTFNLDKFYQDYLRTLGRDENLPPNTY
jgi:Dullard-like phosphatase family protein